MGWAEQQNDKEPLTSTEIYEKGCSMLTGLVVVDGILKNKYPALADGAKTTDYQCPTWELSNCKRDRFDGTKSCSIMKQGLVVNIFNGKQSVFVLGGKHGHYPSSQSAIKIDNNKTIYGIEGEFSNSQAIINQMIKGSAVSTRYQDWPYKLNNDRNIDLSGFKDAYENLKKEYAKLK